MFWRNKHKNNQPQGTEHIRNLVQKKNWVLGIRNVLRSIKNKSVTCRKGRAQTIAPGMADILEERLNATSAFTIVGVDYSGSFTVNLWQRNEKRRCGLFTCITVKGVHIEVAPKLVVDSCLKAISRFTARRGKPSKKIGDNRTKFFEAERKLASTLLHGTKKESKNV